MPELQKKMRLKSDFAPNCNKKLFDCNPKPAEIANFAIPKSKGRATPNLRLSFF